MTEQLKVKLFKLANSEKRPVRIEMTVSLYRLFRSQLSYFEAEQCFDWKRSSVTAWGIPIVISLTNSVVYEEIVPIEGS